MDYYAIICRVKRFNVEKLDNETVYYGAIFLKSGGGYPSKVGDILEWKTDIKKTHNEALQPLYRELERLSYKIKGHKIDCSTI